MRKIIYSIFILITINISCKKENEKDPSTELISGTFHISGKLFKDCSNTPSQNKKVIVGDYGSVCIGCLPYFQGIDSTFSDSSGNFYLEYSVQGLVPNNFLESNVILRNIPYGKNAENVIGYEQKQSIIVLNLNFIRTLSTTDTIQIGFPDSPYFINVNYPFHNGHLITMIHQIYPNSSTYNISNYNISYNIFTINTGNIYKDFSMDECDTTNIVLDIN